MSTAEPLRASYAEYLAAEEVAEVKHEFIRGEIFAMAGGTLEHARLAMNVGAAIMAGLVGKRCAVFNSDARVRIADADVATYPDVSVVCGKLQPASDDRHGMANPTVIVEVLSDSTEAYDRGEKFRRYRALASLKEYVLVSQNDPHIEIFRREANGEWTLSEANRGETAHLKSIDIALDVDALYRDPLA
jgi:Uma2 family endonuclease